MKILIYMAGFFPGKKYGGPPVSVNNFCSLMNEMDCYIVTKNHDHGDSEPYKGILDGWNKRANCRVMYLPDYLYNKKSFEKILLDVKPDVIYLQGIFQSCVLPCLVLAKKYQIKVVLAPRGELCEGAFSLKKYKKAPYIKIIRLSGLVKKIAFQSTSEEESEAIRRLLKIPYSNIFYLPNIPSISCCEHDKNKKEAGSARFIFLSRIHPKKNLMCAISAFLKATGRIIFDIYGPIEDEEYWEKCKAAINNLPDNISVNYCGLVSHEKVHEIFSMYDAFIFPTFSENYGHVIVESLGAGTPVIISDKTPWNDIHDTGAGFVCRLENQEEFAGAINTVVNFDSNQYSQIKNNIKKYLRDKLRLDDLRCDYKEVFSVVAKGDN